MKKFKLYFNNIKSLYYIYFLIIIFAIYDAFTGTYIILKYNYEERMEKNAGFCDKQGYGFIKFIDKNYKKKINENIPVVTFIDSPNAAGYFFDTKKKNSQNYLILLSISDEMFYEQYFGNYRVLEKKSNCYLIKKND